MLAHTEKFSSDEEKAGGGGGSELLDAISLDMSLGVQDSAYTPEID